MHNDSLVKRSSIYPVRIARGFTLIELVIVIAVLAIIVIGILAAINPAEQSYRASDAKLRSTTEQFRKAFSRYGALRTYLPDCYLTNCAHTSGVYLSWLNAAVGQADEGGITNVVRKLINSREITSNFDTISLSDQQEIVYSINGSSVRLCFHPSSKSEQNSGRMRYNCMGTLTTDAACAPYGSSNAGYFECSFIN